MTTCTKLNKSTVLRQREHRSFGAIERIYATGARDGARVTLRSDDRVVLRHHFSMLLLCHPLLQHDSA